MNIGPGISSRRQGPSIAACKMVNWQTGTTILVATAYFPLHSPYPSQVAITDRRTILPCTSAATPPIARTMEETAWSLQLAQPIMNTDVSGPYPDGSNTAGIIGGQARGSHDATYHDGPAVQSQLIAEASTATLQLSRNSLTFPHIHATRGSTGFEQGHDDLPYDPIPHASIQSSNSMCFRIDRRTTGHCSAPYSIMYRQERSRGPIYNGNIYGGVNYNMSNVEERNSPARFIITVAYQLAASIHELVPHIENAIKRNPMILRKALEIQLMKLIVEPFKALGKVDDMPNRLVIVDGLDECINSDQEYRLERQYAEDQEKAQIRILDIIHTLQSHRLPLSFLILSRPEAWIKQHMQSASFKRVVEVVDLYALGDHMKDTEAYIRAEISRIATRIQGDGAPDQANDEWPGEDVVQFFVRRTNGHMLFASTVIRHIDNPYGDPRSLLQHLIRGYAYPDPDLAHSSPLSFLSELYMQIMRSCPESNRTLMIEVLEDISACAQYFRVDVDFHRALAVLDHLAGRVPGQGSRAIRPLHAVLRLSGTMGPNNTSSHLSPFIHTSFPDFLQDPGLSLEFAIDRDQGFQRILCGCLDFMSKMAPHSEVVADHCLFASTVWPWLFNYVWKSKLPDGEYFESLKKLLSIDLVACSTKAHRLRNSVTLTVFFPIMSIYRHDCHNPIVAQSSPHIFESEPIVQQAVAHVASSLESGLGSFLREPPDVWSDEFRVLVLNFLAYHKRSSDYSDPLRTAYESNRVVEALKMLKKDKPEHISKLTKGYEARFKQYLPVD
ncbi:hypothetical protein EST38_g11613 [Candolleomyces aberdarensis]|uniref:Nephrocystin 3-like N-terminal domain-containing protein n=1 Tax=Candolleomyces aberdarensis TaxID=2316362 RepID=A0A4V1Q288_9AGAR|nr:hypothetical protein EST38_g11613 [Candolleomyces aberdarensis]